MYKSIGIVVLSLCLSACSALLFYPSPDWVRTPDELGLKYRDVKIQSTDGTNLSAWWLDAVGEPKGTVVFLHGNAENISTHIGSVYWLPEQGYQVLLLDYRGYGHSEGVPDLPEVFDDIRAAFKWTFTQPQTKNRPVFLLAQSLGASMGGYVVGKDKIISSRFDGVVLDAGFGSYASTAKEVAARNWLTWIFKYPAAWSMPADYDLQDYIASIGPTPLLIIHGSEDAVVPFKNSEELFKEARAPKFFLKYQGAHIETFSYEANRKALLDFFAESKSTDN